MTDPAPLRTPFPAISFPPPAGRPESTLWAVLLVHVAALDAFYGRVQKAHRLSRTLHKLQDESILALTRLSGRPYALMARGIGADAGRDAPETMGCEIGWWSEAASASLGLAMTLGLQTPVPDEAVVACEAHKKVRMGLFLMFPEGVSRKLLQNLGGEASRDLIHGWALRQLDLECGACIS